ncbi:hypothetical protein F5148DRAFT_1179618 [Russula earlei]|uniref:Uncharacterized protein n=1 Tax=Russula earlei TaxID=71964 RepID=A0ACC0UFF3_9AGAM|nr:hypothetical protein F5148DRAFT_1179618 [Russula earlei]
MNSGEVRACSRGEKENRNDVKKSNDKKKQRIPAGLALMHGFASASVGKSRLTIERPPNFGVFNKGRASGKVKVNESKRTKQRGFRSHIFSEDKFLSSRRAKSPVKCLLHSETSSSSDASNEPSTPVKAKKLTTAMTRNTPIKLRGTIGRSQCESEMNDGSTSPPVDGEGVKSTDMAKPKKSRSPARSASWVIEQDGCSLPSTTTDIAIACVKSKPGTALLDVRTAAWSRGLNEDLCNEKNPSLLKRHESPQAISTLQATAIVQGDASATHIEVDERGTIGPWESASQIAQSTLHPQEQRSAHSRYFALPYSGELKFIEPTIHLANNSFGQPADLDRGCSNKGEDMIIDRDLAGAGHHRGDLLTISSPANISPARKPSTLPEERISVLQTSSLDSVDRALLDIPVVNRSRSRIRRGLTKWHEFNATSELLFRHYGLDPMDSPSEVLRPSLDDHGDCEPANAGDSLEEPIALGNVQDGALSFRRGGFPKVLSLRVRWRPPHRTLRSIVEMKRVYSMKKTRDT